MTRQQKRNIWIMAVLIAAMGIGIAMRWDFIKGEVGAMVDKMFPPQTEQGAPSGQ